MQQRGLPSPDRADAMAIAFAGKANAVPMNMESPRREHCGVRDGLVQPAACGDPAARERVAARS
jgi:hypothetical protein